LCKTFLFSAPDDGHLVGRNTLLQV
jgi:hypothetical protein